MALTIGCSSVPGTVLAERTSEDWLSILPQDAFLYLTAGLSPDSRDIVKSVLEADGDVGAVIDRTDRIYAAVRTAQAGGGEIAEPGGAVRGIYAILMGSYPSSLASLSLSLNDQWDRQRIGRGREKEYWASVSGDIKLSLPHRRVLLMSSEDIKSLMTGYTTGGADKIRWPEGLLEVADTAEVLAYVPRFNELPLPVAAQVKAPIRETWAWLGRTQDHSFDANTVFCMETAQDADRFTRAARLLVVFLLKGAQVEDLSSRLDKVEVSRLDSKVVLSGLILNRRDLEMLIQYFREGQE